MLLVISKVRAPSIVVTPEVRLIVRLPPLPFVTIRTELFSRLALTLLKLVIATNSLDMSKAYADFTATTSMAITNFSNIDPTKENSSVLIVTNGSGGNLTMSLNSGVTTMDGARSCVMTNNTVTIFSFSVYGNRWTNVAYRTFY